MHSIAISVISLYSRHHNRQSGHLACNFLSLRVSQQIRTWPGLLKPKRAYRIRCQSEHRMNMSQLSREQLHSLPGVAKARDPATEGFEFQQTMLRVMDAERSLKFYTEVLGMTLLSRFDFADMKFSLYFLGYADPDEIPDDPVERARWMFSRPGCLELTHNWLTEEEKKELQEKGGYHSGNSDPRGFGHIGISVPSVDKACDRFEKMGVEFVKRPQDGKMKFVAFIKDPDGYWIEILSPDSAKPIVNWPSA